MKFKMKQSVKLVESGETGTVVGTAQYADASDSYLIRYKAGDGRQVEAWWTESSLTDKRVAKDPVPAEGEGG